MKNNNLKPTLIKLLITVVVGAVYFYVALPAINLQDPEFYTFFMLLLGLYCFLSIVSQGIRVSATPSELWQSIRQHSTLPLVVLLVLVAIYGVGTLLSSPVLRSRSYRDLLTVETGDFTAEIEEISFNQIPMLDEDSARRLGDRRMGEMADMGLVSQFEVASDYTQINYNGHPVRVTPLRYGDPIKWLNNRKSGIPAYMIIDMVKQNVEVVRISEIMPDKTGIFYSTAEHFTRNLARHLRFNYPTYMFDPANFEIDEDGVPYWVCPRVVKRIGLFGGKDIDGAVLVNAVTGESQYCAAGEIPSWVDRVFTSSLIMQQYDYHGQYQNGFINSILGQRDVTVTSEGYNYIAVGDDVYMYTGITSGGADFSIIGFILTNQRTKETVFYPVAGAMETSAMGSARGAVQHLNYSSTFPLLLNISSQPTYFMALKDAAGLVKKYAMVNVVEYNIVATGDTVSETNLNYIELLARSNLFPGTVQDTETISGVIDDIRTAVIEGNTRVYLRLQGNDFYYSVSAADSELAIVLNIGDRISLNTAANSGIIRPAYGLELH